MPKRRMELEWGDRSIYLGPGDDPGKAALHYYGGMANGSSLVDLNGIDIAGLVELVNNLPGVEATYTPPAPEPVVTTFGELTPGTVYCNGSGLNNTGFRYVKLADGSIISVGSNPGERHPADPARDARIVTVVPS